MFSGTMALRAFRASSVQVTRVTTPAVSSHRALGSLRGTPSPIRAQRRCMSVFLSSGQGRSKKAQERFVRERRKVVIWSNVLGMTFVTIMAMISFERSIRGSSIYHSIADWAGSGLLDKDPEEAHKLAIEILVNGLGIVDNSPSVDALKSTVMGLEFDNPVGIAAGFDKNAEVLLPLFDMGAGFVEVGGVTPYRQEGNPKPRVFRLAEDKAVINRYGLNSDGANVVSQRLIKAREQIYKDSHTLLGKSKSKVVGCNIAANTLSKDKTEDYCQMVESVGRIVDFIVLNVSCPNTAFTAELASNSNMMDDLVRDVTTYLKNMVKKDNDFFKLEKKPPAILLKVSPDMNDSQKEHMAKVAMAYNVDGLVISNTTRSRPPTLQSAHASEAGGLSGRPVKEAALQTCHDMYKLTRGTIPIIGVGGIETPEDAYKRIRAGASLVQMYTAMIYEGPTLVLRMKEGILSLLHADGFSHISEAVGADHRDTATTSSSSSPSSSSFPITSAS